MHSLTRWVLRAAIAQVEAWEAAGLRLTMAVNLAMPNLLDPGLPDEVAALLARHAWPPSGSCSRSPRSS